MAAGCENPSFKGVIDRLNQWLPAVLSAAAAKLRKRLVTDLIELITNAISEGINYKIQAIKANARTLMNFKDYRTRILFFCGKLSLVP
ncbi:transposase [Akkermansiaceae bacterium]|nr:transposase [Akkermansiaceae bacterium]